MSARPDETALDAVSGRQVLVAVLASTFEWALDLFDLFILLFVAPVVGRLFFPSGVATLSLAAVYASFCCRTASSPSLARRPMQRR